MSTAFADHLPTGNHAGRPAATDVPQGALYSCTTHNLVYQSNGATWSTWAALGGGAPAAHAASHQDGGADEIDVTGLTGAGGGGGGVTGKRPIQDRSTGAGAQATSRAVTLSAAPTNGNLLLAMIAIETGTMAVTSIVQTNVTWTQLAETTDNSTPKVELWKGVVAASAGTGITVNYSGSTYNGVHVSEWNGITGTIVDSASVVAGTLSNLGGTFPRTPTLLNTSANALVIGGSTTTNNNTYSRMIGGTNFNDMLVTGCSLAVAYDFPGLRAVNFVSVTGSGAATFSALIVSMT